MYLNTDSNRLNPGDAFVIRILYSCRQDKAYTWNNCMELYGLFNIDLNHKMTVSVASFTFDQIGLIRPLIDPI